MIQAQNNDDFKEWDQFVNANPKGNHLVLSDWLDSYKSYGFKKEIVFLKEEGTIVGGYGAVIARFSIFKFYIIPYGPIVQKGYESKIPFLIEEARQKAVSASCCYFQITIPKSTDANIKSYSYDAAFTLDPKYIKGNPFKYVYAADGVNYVGLKGYNQENLDSLLMSFSVRTRRDIRIGLKNSSKIKQAKHSEEIKEAYNLCIQNAKQQHYNIREWTSLSRTLTDLITSNKGIFLMAYTPDKLVGSAFFLKSGNHLTYIFGGTKKEYSNVYPGYALQWEAIKISVALGYEWYNISLGGSEGVKKFKSKFNSTEIFYENAQYHRILNSIKFSSFMLIEKRIKPYKASIGKWLSRIKK